MNPLGWVRHESAERGRVMPQLTVGIWSPSWSGLVGLLGCCVDCGKGV